MSIRQSCWLCAWWLAWSVCALAWSDEIAPPIEYSRIFVPHDRLTDFQGDYVPLQRDRFDELMAVANESAENEFKVAHVQQATYRAQLQDNQLVNGTAVLTVVGRPDKTTKLSLAGSGLPIRRARWSPSQPAQVGLSSAGEAIALVPANATALSLMFDWSAGGQVTTWSAMQFRIQLPRCPQNVLQLSLPEGLRLTSTRGIVTSRSGEAGRVEWQIELGSTTETNLSVADVSGSRFPLTTYHQSCEYHVAAYGVEGTVQMDLDVVSDELSQLELECEESIQIKRFLVDGRPVEWSQVTIPTGEDLEREVTRIQPLGIHLALGHHHIEIDLLASDRVTSDGIVLPRMQPAGLLWTSGRVVATVVRPLFVEDIQTSGVQLTDQTLVDVPPSAQRLEWNSLRRDHRIRLVARTQQTSLRAMSGISITLGNTNTLGRFKTHLTAHSGETHLITANVDREWTIDAVEVQPEGILSDWSVMDGPGTHRQLLIRLATPLSTDQPLDILVEGQRRRIVPTVPIAFGRLDFVRLQDVEVYDAVAAIRSSRSTRLRVANPEAVSVLDTVTLTTQQSRLLDAERGDFIFRRTAASRGLRVAQQPGRPQFDSQIHVTATLGQQEIDERTRVECLSQSSPLKQLLIAFDPPRDEPVRWTDATGVELSAEKLSSKQRTDLSCEEWDEVWRVVLADEAASERVVIGQRRIPFVWNPAAEYQPAVAFTPAASAQDNLVTLKAADSAALYRVHTELEKRPSLGGDSHEFEKTIGTFLETGGDGEQDAIRVSRRPQSQSRMAWIWHGVTRSRFEGTGAVVHESAWRIENHGRAEIRWQIADRELHVVAVDGALVDASAVDSEGWLRVPLPPNRRWVEVTMEYGKRVPAGKLLQRVKFSPPVADVQELLHEWSVALPSQYAEWSGRYAAHRSWTSRLFGRMARSWYTELDGMVTPSNPAAMARVIDAGSVTSQPAVLTFYWVNAARLLAWLIFLTLVVLRPRFATATYVLLMGAAAVLTLICPAALILPFRGTLWGLAAARVSGWLPVYQGSLKYRSQVAAAIVAWALIAWACHGDSVHAQAAENRQEDSFRVLFPVDSAGEAVGKYVYLPQKMYDRLLRTAKRRRSVTDSWIVGETLYSGRLASGADTMDEGHPTVQTVDVAMKIGTFRPGITVDVPLAGAPAAGAVTLDGGELETSVVDGGNKLRFVVMNEGEHWLRYSVEPTIEDLGDDRAFELVIPPNPTSRFEFVIPVGNKLRMSGRIGGAQLGMDDRRFQVDLGPIDSISCRWQSDAALVAGSVQKAIVDMLSWVHIEPGLSVQYLQFFPSDSDEPLERVEFEIPPDVIPAPLDPQIGRVEVANQGNNRRIVTVIRDAENRHAGLQVALMLLQVRGAGDHLVAPIHLTRSAIGSIWMGATVSDALILERGMHDGFASVSGKVFREQWGNGSPRPQLPFPEYIEARVAEGAIWNFRVLERRSQLVVECRTDVTYTADKVMIDYQAEMAPLESGLYQHQFVVPLGMKITNIVLKSDGSPTPARWAMIGQDRVNVFLDHPTLGPYGIEIEGEMQVPADPSPISVVPRIQITEVPVTSWATTIYRTSDVAVELVGDRSASASEEVASNHHVDSQRFVAKVDGDVELRVRVTANDPIISGRQLTQLRHAGAAWYTDCFLQLTFERGVPDELRFELTSDSVELVEVVPSLPWRMESTPGGNRQLIVDTELDADADSLDLQLIVRKPNNDAIDSVPVRLVNTRMVEDWLALPDRLGNQQLEWKTSGMEPAEMPWELRKPSRSSMDDLLYRITTRSADFSLQRSVAATDAPTVIFRDVEFHLSRDTVTGVVAMDVDPAGIRQAILRVPDGCDVVAVLIDEQFAATEPLSPNRIGVWVGGQHLPIHVTVVFRVSSPKMHRNPTVWTTPLFESMPTQQTVWTLYSDDTHIHFLGLPQTDPMDANQLRQSRLNGGLKSMQTSIRSVQRFSRQELQSWFQRWQRRVIERMGPSDDLTLAVTEKQQQVVQAEMLELARELRLSDSSTVLLDRVDQPAIGPLDVFPLQGSNHRHVAGPFSFSTTEPTGTLSLDSRRSDWQFVPRTLLPCLAIGLVAVALASVASSGRWRSAFLRWPQTVMLGWGAIWCCYLIWPAVGIGMMGLACWLALTSVRFGTVPEGRL